MEINDDISHFITGLVIFLIFIVVHQMQTNINALLDLSWKSVCQRESSVENNHQTAAQGRDYG